MLNNPWGGFKVIPNDLLVVTETTRVKRSWYTRLFSGLFTKNWKPSLTHTVTIETKPDPRVIFTADSIIAHPDIIAQIMSTL